MQQLYDELDENQVVVQTLKLIPGLTLPEGHTWVLHQPTIQEERQALLSQIFQNREIKCQQPVLALGQQWQADSISQSLLSQAILLAQIQAAPVPPTWRTLDNQDISVTLDDLKAIAFAIAAQTQLAYSRSWELKALVASATTIDELNAITLD